MKALPLKKRPPRETLGNRLAYTFSKMKPGQSFLVETVGERSYVLNVAKKLGVHVTTFKVNGHGYDVRLAK